MPFVSFPLTTIIRPIIYPISLPQIMSYALATDFKKYILVYGLNDHSFSQKEEKKSENSQTTIFFSISQQIIQQKSQNKQLEPCEQNRKTIDSISIKKKKESIKSRIPRKRLCYERARIQINEALQFSQETDEEKENKSERKEEQIRNIYKIKYKEQIKQRPVRKQKKIKKSRKWHRCIPIVEPEQKTQISTRVSLIDTIDYPKIGIDRYEIEQKRQKLLSRAIVYDEFETRNQAYRIEQRRQVKRLNLFI